MLVVVHHPDPARHGLRRTLDPGEQLELGRKGTALGPGTLDDGRLSRRHCAITASGRGLHVRDLGSRNGTWVDGRRVEQAGLDPGTVLSVGSLLMISARLPQGWTPARVPELAIHSPELDAVVRRATTLAPLPTPVLVLGETGTGKEGIARVLHRASGRAGPLRAVNCGAMDDQVLRSELFGHVRGAFTGAASDRCGLIEDARDGTLLLDEIGEASPALQASLLRVLQEGEVRRVGANRPVRVQTRFIAATHRDLLDGVAQGTFREDLYARLAGWTLEIPPLRERRLDILPIARAAAEARLGRPVRLHRSLALRLLLLPWPRNVRELVHTVERLVVDVDEDLLGLDEALVPALPQKPPLRDPEDRRRAAERPPPQALEQELRAHEGRVADCAQALGVSRVTLYRWIRADGIDLEAVRQG